MSALVGSAMLSLVDDEQHGRLDQVHTWPSEQLDTLVEIVRDLVHIGQRAEH
jgi:hypothetical protein